MTETRKNLVNALDWFSLYVTSLLEYHVNGDLKPEPPPLQLAGDDGGLGDVFRELDPSLSEVVVIMLALAPHLQPHLLDQIVAKVFPEGGELPLLGGVRSQSSRLFLPTGQTAAFILGGRDVEAGLRVRRMLSNDGRLTQMRLVWLENVAEGEPAISGRLGIDPDIVELLQLGSIAPPRFSQDFPAEYITTELEWGDLILQDDTVKQIQEIQNWVAYNDRVMTEWGLGKRVKPGYRALFFGPPGTGKTLTATLLGKSTGRDVFRIDLSQVVSKYIGETEKNLSRIFDRAENKDWILFFDEADALFSKRTEVRDSHDKYANQEVSYLLQRIESFNGLVILATNQRNNIDSAFVRRLQSIIYFPMPRAEERLRLWQTSLAHNTPLSDDVDLARLATQYELSGASIINVIHYCAIQTAADQSNCISHKQLENAILREYFKEGKVV